MWQRGVHRLASRLGARLIADAGDAAWQGRTVTGKQGAQWLNAGLAERWFRGRLAKALGDPHRPDAQPEDGPPSDPSAPGPAPVGSVSTRLIRD